MATRASKSLNILLQSQCSVKWCRNVLGRRIIKKIIHQPSCSIASNVGQKCLLQVAIIGEPNCGKSTLTNSLVGNQVSTVTCVPHTTRQRTIGVFTEGIINDRLKCHHTTWFDRVLIKQTEIIN